MAPLARLLTTSLWLLPALAQTNTDNSNQDVKVWAAVAYVNHGEKTPDTYGMNAVLTPIGAQQMLKQGQTFRARYLSGSGKANSSDEDTIKTAPIQGIETDSIVNSQLALSAQADQWTIASAMAFLQGLYPPAKAKFPSILSTSDLANDLVSDTTADYPLNGYQYPMILTPASSDPGSVVLEGTTGCTEWDTQMSSNLTKRADLKESAESSQSFYDKLFSTPGLQNTISADDFNYWNAYNVYQLVSYLYRHNETVHKTLENANETLATLEAHAAELEFAKTSDAVALNSDPLNKLYTVAGRTLGLRILEQLKNSILSAGDRNKLTLMFGSVRPMTSLFSVVGLLNRQNTQSGPLSRLPELGATLIIELVSDDTDSAMPEENKLQVRFYYYPDAVSQNEPTLFSLYGSGIGGYSIPYSTFKTHMENDGLTPEQWCDICKTSSSWCASDSSDSSDSSSGGSNSKGPSGLSRAVAGVIGAVVTAAIFGLIFLVVFGILGFRIQRSHPQSREGVFGGFKGPEKRPSDPDLTTSKGGAAQERIGSWEMRDDGAAISTSDFSRRGGRRVEEDGISVLDATPVRAHESV